MNFHLFIRFMSIRRKTALALNIFNGVAFGSTNLGVVIEGESVVNLRFCKKRPEMIMFSLRLTARMLVGVIKFQYREG